MTFKQVVKKYNLKREYVEKRDGATQFIIYGIRSHPYTKDTSKYDSLKFLVQFTRWEDAENGYGCYAYHTPLLNIQEAVKIHDEMIDDMQGKGRKAFNSIDVYGFDENGNSFIVYTWLLKGVSRHAL